MLHIISINAERAGADSLFIAFLKPDNQQTGYFFATMSYKSTIWKILISPLVQSNQSQLTIRWLNENAAGKHGKSESTIQGPHFSILKLHNFQIKH